jgi:hypothetical protein
MSDVGFMLPGVTTSYPYISLTGAIADKASPLRAYFDKRFPNRATLQATYRAGSGELLVPGGSSNPGTLGAAFDVLARLTLDPTTVPSVAVVGFIESPEAIASVRRAIEAGAAATAGWAATGPRQRSSSGLSGPRRCASRSTARGW